MGRHETCWAGECGLGEHFDFEVQILDIIANSVDMDTLQRGGQTQ
jgi:hypothetical protein